MRRAAPVVRVRGHSPVLALVPLRQLERAAADHRLAVFEERRLLDVVAGRLAPDVLGQDVLVHEHGLAREQRRRLLALDDHRGGVRGGGALEQREVVERVSSHVVLLVVVQRPRHVIGGEGLAVGPLHVGAGGT